VPEGGYRQNVCDEVPRQETHQDEARRDARTQRADYALSSQYRGKYVFMLKVMTRKI
jgi:hypothetical protein